MNNFLEEYLVYLRYEKQVSDNTYSSYGRDLKKWLAYLAQNGVNRIQDVKQKHLQDYIDYLNREEYAPTTVTRSFIAMKSFLKFLCMRGVLSENPAGMIELPKAFVKPNLKLTKKEMDTLLNPPVVFSFKGLRDRAMLLLLYNTKISISDMVRLKVSAIDFEQNRLVYEKDGQCKTCSFGPEVEEALSVYIEYKRLTKDEWLFPNRYGNPMSRQGFWKTIKTYASDLGIEKDITLYSIKQGEI